MILNHAHEGYEYQDLLTVYFILKELIYEKNSKFIIDKKEYDYDKFDDLKIINEELIQQKQIKYSNKKVDYTISKDDLSNGGNHDIALDTLFLSWKECNEKNTENINIETRLCLAWNSPSQDDKINKILEKISSDTVEKTFNKTEIYKIKLSELWPKGEEPLSDWRRFKAEAKKFDRDEFEIFCNELIIELNYPKASLDIFNPGELELEVIELTKRIGIGRFPNEMIKIEDAVLELSHIVKNARSQGNELDVKGIIYKLGLKTNYGSIKQTIKINKDLNISLNNRYEDFYNLIKNKNKVFLYGEPGSGKTWFITNLQEYIKQKGVQIIRHYCYTGLDDENDIKRIQTNIFYGNLVNDILKINPKLKKNNKYAADKEELENLLNQIDDELIVFVDGLDHIDRVYEMNKDKLKKDEIDVIKSIENLKVNKNIKIVISSQPLSETTEIEKSGFELIKIKSWKIEEVKLLMIRFKISDILISQNELSKVLLEKSKGNPLYLTYLLSEIKDVDILVKSELDRIPQYNGDLKDYYNYIIKKLNGKGECILKPLSGIKFFVNRKELKEITGEGDYVDEALDTLKPILEENLCSRGVMIYHESFRRYILDQYREKGVDLKKKIYRDIIEWFEKIDFISSPKAYRNYLNILLDVQEYSKILTYLDKEFFVNSLVQGYSRELIIRNYNIFLNAATKINSFYDIALILQLGNQIDSTRVEFDEIKDLYFNAVGYIYGFDRVNNLLSYEGECTLNRQDGLEVCYLCSTKGVIPPWELYLDIDGEEICIDEFKYYVRYLFDLKNKEKIKNIIERISGTEFDDFKYYFLNETKKYNLFNEIKTDILQLSIEQWNDYLNDYSNSIITVNCGELETLISKILNIDYLQEEDVSNIKKLLLVIKKLLNNKSYSIEQITKKFEKINWFYNWIIFCIKIVCLESNMSGKDNPEIDSELESIYSYLIMDTEPFKGKLRTCDLYNIEEFIRLKIYEPLKYINSKKTWEVILNILTKVSYETTSSLRGTIGGPLPTDKYIALLEKIANDMNIDIICEIIEKICEKESNYTFYSYLADYDLKCSILYGKINDIEKAKSKLKEGIKYITSYTFRKDDTLSNLINSIDVIYNINNDIGKDKILKLFDLSDRVRHHTDGSGTSHYLTECYTKLLKYNKIDALILLQNQMLKYPNYWINDEYLEEFLNKYSNECEFSKSYLYRMYLNKVSLGYLNGFIKNIKSLYSDNKERSAYICFVSLVSRLDLIKDKYNEKTKIYNDIIGLSKLFKIDVNSLNNLSILNNSIIQEHYKTTNLANELEIIQFSKLSINEFIEYFRKNILKKEKINSFIYYCENIVSSSEDITIIIDQLISDDFIFDREEHSNNLKIAFENMKIDPILKCYFYIRFYCYKKDGWYHRFVDRSLLEKAYKINAEFTIEKMNEFIYEIFKNTKYDSMSFSNLMIGLYSINYDNDEILKSWENMYDIIEYRLSGGKYDYTNMIINQMSMNLEEIILTLILSQLNKGKVTTEKLVIDCIYYYLNHDCSKLYKPFKWFFRNYNKFSEMNISIILQLIWEHRNTIDYISELREDLKKLYSCNNFMITFLLNYILNIKEEVKKIILDNKELTIDNMKMNYCMMLNSNIPYFKSIGFDIKSIYKNFFYEINNNKCKEMCNIYFNKIYKILVKNIFQENIFYKILNRNLLYCYYSGIKYEYNKIFKKQLFDINSIIACENSKIIRPIKPNLLCEGEDTVEYIPIDFNEEWIEIAYHEVEMVDISYGKLERKELIKTIVFDRDIDDPFNNLITKNIWDDNLDNENIDYNKLVFKESEIYNFENNKLLWIDIKLLELLNLHLGKCEEGLIAMNDSKDIVLKFENWELNYIGDDRYTSNEIPKIVGQRLRIKKEYLEKICELMDKEAEYILIYLYV